MSLLYSDKYSHATNILNMFKVVAQPCPDMTVHINQGTIIYENTILNIPEQDSEVITAPQIGTWIVAISINNKGELVYTYGIQSVDVKYMPNLPKECVHLCLIEVSATSAHITQDMISDLRQLYHYSNSTDSCQCKCTIDSSFTDADRKTLQEFYNKYSQLVEDVDKLRTKLSPHKEYTVLSDSGLEYTLRFHDDGTPYTTRVGFDNSATNKNSKEQPIEDYKFEIRNSTVNVVCNSQLEYIQVPVRIKSDDAKNQTINATLFVRCNNATIYSENYTPQYRENEYKIDNLVLSPDGFYEMFTIRFHNSGNQTLTLLVYDNDNQKLLDEGCVSYDVTFRDETY